MLRLIARSFAPFAPFAVKCLRGFWSTALRSFIDDAGAILRLPCLPNTFATADPAVDRPLPTEPG